MTEIFLHADAPDKPPEGAPCNGCGVCCALSPCPLSRFLLGHRAGACPALRWERTRYVCGLVNGRTNVARWLPRRLVLRWIGSGCGCDCLAEVEVMAKKSAYNAHGDGRASVEPEVVPDQGKSNGSRT